MEADGGAHNIRVYGNRGVNAFHNGLSSQPIFGGPVYFFRNVLYNIPAGGAFKFNAKPGVKAQYVAGEDSKEKKWVTWPHYATLIFDVELIAIK